MKRWLAFGLLVALGCASAGLRSRTFTVHVTSHSWAAKAVRVYCDNGELLTTVRGVTMGNPVVKRALWRRSCQGVSVTVELLGGRWYRHVQYQPLEAGDTLRVEVGQPLGTTRVWRTALFHNAAGTPTLAVDIVWLTPIGLHMGIWHDVERCVGATGDPNTVRWGTARYLITPDSLLAYGLTAFTDAGEPWAIIVDRRPEGVGYWLHPTVISHEVIHALTGMSEQELHETGAINCEMPLPDTLHERSIPGDTLRYYRDLVNRR